MKKYHKIETIYKRDMEGTKKLIEGVYRNPAVEYLKDNQWIFTEKIDGTNIRVQWDGHKVYFAGRTDAAQIPSFLLNDSLVPTFIGSKNEQLFEERFGENEVTLFGEGYGAKIQKGGGLYRKDTGFIMFDVMVGDVFLERRAVEEVAEAFGVPCVPVYLTGTIEEAVAIVKTNPFSLVAEEEKHIEGLIGIPKTRLLTHMGDRVIVKIKVEDIANQENHE